MSWEHLEEIITVHIQLFDFFVSTKATYTDLSTDTLITLIPLLRGICVLLHKINVTKQQLPQNILSKIPYRIIRFLMMNTRISMNLTFFLKSACFNYHDFLHAQMWHISALTVMMGKGICTLTNDTHGWKEGYVEVDLSFKGHLIKLWWPRLKISKFVIITQ